MNRPLLLFLCVFAGGMVLRPLPGVGTAFGSPFLYLLVLLAVAAAVTYGAELAHDRRVLARGVAKWKGATSPYHVGKLGCLYLSHGRARQAAEHLERAVAGEPHIPEWSYRLGLAYVKLGRPRAALTAFERAFAVAPGHGFGALQLARARALARCGDFAGALAAIDEQEREYSPSPESTYRAARLLARMGRTAEAQRRFDDVKRLAAKAKGHQRRKQRLWVLRAQVARFVAGLPRVAWRAPVAATGGPRLTPEG